MASEENEQEPADSPAKAEPSAGSFRELWRVAFPLIISWGSISLMHVCDRVFLAWESEEALAASLPAGMLHFMLMSLPLGVVMYANTFVAQYNGARKLERAAAAVWQGVWLSIAGAALLMAFVPLAPAFFGSFDHGPGVIEQELTYFNLLVWGSAPFLISATLSCWFSGRGKTRVVMWIDVASVIVNIVLDPIFIFGLGTESQQFVPAMGIAGAAVASIIAKVVAVICYAVWIAKEKAAKDCDFYRRAGLDRGLLARIGKYGFPNGMQFLLDVSAFTIFLMLVGNLGESELAATNIAFNLNSFAFVPLIGIGIAVSTLVGQRVGEERPELATRTTHLAVGLGIAWQFLFVPFYLFAPDLLLLPYEARMNPDEFAKVRDVAGVLMKYIAIYCIFDAAAIVFGSAVRGAGDTRFSLIFSLIAGWGLLVLPVGWNIYYGEPSLHFAWWFATAYIVVLGIGFWYRFRAGKWKQMSVIRDEDADEREPDVPPVPSTHAPEVSAVAE